MQGGAAVEKGETSGLNDIWILNEEALRGWRQAALCSKINVSLNRHTYKQRASSLCFLMPSDTSLLISVLLRDLRGVSRLLNMRDPFMFSHLRDSAITNDLRRGEDDDDGGGRRKNTANFRFEQ